MKHKKPQFSKCWLVGCVAIALIFTAISYVLAAMDKNPVSDLSIAILDTLWGTSGVSFIGYAVQNCVRAFTASKFGIPDEKEDVQNGNNGDEYKNNWNNIDTADICDSDSYIDTVRGKSEAEGNPVAQVRRVRSRKGTR